MTKARLSTTEMITAYLNGSSYQQIADQAGVSRQRIGQIMNANNIKPGRPPLKPKRGAKRLTDEQIIANGNRRSQTLRGLLKTIPYDSKYNKQECAIAVVAVTKLLGKRPTVTQYDKLRSALTKEDLPSVSTINTHFGSWSLCLRYIQALGLTLVEPQS